MNAPADPVRALLREHDELCAQAVDPLEIAAGLEARGVDEATVARCRHRDVFSLAEELHARAPWSRPPASRPVARRPGAAALLLPLLPGALTAAGLALLARLPAEAAPGRTALALATGALTLLVVLALLARRSPPGLVGLLALPPVAYALAGDGLLDELLPGRQQETGPAAAVALLLALAVAPVVWCRDGFGRRAGPLLERRRLREFRAGVRALLARTTLLLVAGLLLALAVVRCAPASLTGGAQPGVTALACLALGLLLGLAALLVGYGQRRVAAGGLALACGAEALALALVSASWVPGLGSLADPVARLVEAGGPAAVPLLSCLAGCCWLLARAAVVLPRASVHRARLPRAPAPRPFELSLPTATAEPFTREEHDKR
ncbi:hypothetical protein [Streptomyces profundus]|uniref:hypothetical protein n=1 Tax=Streptomyces profundus TaxID=2867410 RepID=UPI001D16C3DA|nr:hypothetical protein [Streptomyces sp. MA3_2.13]UED84320.1 hypothetical protein K4G22_08965 [Streptomyces sp. MA3_2.13]